jgi:hypothetical protein
MTELKKMLAMGRSPSPSLGGHRLVVNAKDPKKIDLPTLENYQCKLTGTVCPLYLSAMLPACVE